MVLDLVAQHAGRKLSTFFFAPMRPQQSFPMPLMAYGISVKNLGKMVSLIVDAQSALLTVVNMSTMRPTSWNYFWTDFWRVFKRSPAASGIQKNFVIYHTKNLYSTSKMKDSPTEREFPAYQCQYSLLRTPAIEFYISSNRVRVAHDP